MSSVNVVDASSLKRSLYFSFQVLEMGFPVVVALNMMDVARRNGTEINVKTLQKKLKVPVVPTVGRKGVGKNDLRDAILEVSGYDDQGYKQGATQDPLHIHYDELEKPIEDLRKLLEQTPLKEKYPCRWLAVKLVEGDSEAERIVTEALGASCHELEAARGVKAIFEDEYDMDSSRLHDGLPEINLPPK